METVIGVLSKNVWEPLGAEGRLSPTRGLTTLCPNPHVQSFQLQLQAPSGDTVPARGGLPVTQLFRILNPNKVSGQTLWDRRGGGSQGPDPGLRFPTFRQL